MSHMPAFMEHIKYSNNERVMNKCSEQCPTQTKERDDNIYHLNSSRKS